MKEDAFAKVEQLGIWFDIGKQATHVQSQLLEHTLFDNAVAVKQIREKGIAVDGIQMGFFDRKLSRTLHIA